MKRSSFIKYSALGTLGLLWSSKNSFASMLTKAGYTVTMLTPKVGMFSEKGGTVVFYLGKKGVTVVDTQFNDSIVNLIADLKQKGHEKFQLLINTHHHGDHTGGNIAFKDLVKTVVGHKNCLANHKANAEKSKNADKQLFATETFETTWSKKLDKKETVKLHYFGAGHTNGDAVVEFVKNKVVHCGDLMFNRRFPFIDKTTGANIKSWIDVLQKIQNEFDEKTIFVFGHASETHSVMGTRYDLAAFATYLTQLLDYVTQAVKEGKTKEEITKAKAIPGNTEWTGAGIERGLIAAYTEVVEGK